VLAVRARNHRRIPLTNDVVFVAIMIAFFALAALFVVACDKLIGPDDEALALGDEELAPAPPPEPERLAA
jgi:hypothetical protein